MVNIESSLIQSLNSVIIHRGDITTGGKIFIYLKSHHLNRWIRCRNEHVTWATTEEVFEGSFGYHTEPQGYQALIASSTAVGLIYLRESELHHLARVMEPYTGVVYKHLTISRFFKTF